MRLSCDGCGRFLEGVATAVYTASADEVDLCSECASEATTLVRTTVGKRLSQAAKQQRREKRKEQGSAGRAARARASVAFADGMDVE